MSILACIGHTRLVPLRHLVPEGSARVLLKLEYENPTGSMKDRMALAMVEAAEADGRLKPASSGEGGAVVEYTGGSTGVSLAFVCAAKRIPLEIVTSEAFSEEKRTHMAALGARLTLVPSPTGGTTRALTLAMIETARRIAATLPGSYWTDQLNNADVLPGYGRMADEIWQQAEQRVDGFVQAVGTAGSFRGIATRLRDLNPALRAVAVEPTESAVLSGGASGSHKIEGTGPGFVPSLWRGDLADAIRPVASVDAMAMTRRLAREEGIFAGTSTGANVIAALELARQLGPDKTVVTLAVDSGMKYLSTALYAGGTQAA
ncbi:PLP-dependent cysteine synthase family protein [Ferrovibrio xuzhouensis]|uniref:PLP-dependent cysteine synthase family protein n=1 Tax=Ferrovibrio xuzhouensis TaxID=1576914 RepID=A0ABV7VEC1_9PROT